MIYKTFICKNEVATWRNSDTITIVFNNKMYKE